MLPSFFTQDVFSIQSKKTFDEMALRVFEYQSQKCNVYKKYIDLMGVNPKGVTKIEQIPFLPIGFFKSASVRCRKKTEVLFKSSGTSGGVESKHFVADLALYTSS